ncbi:MAG: hypothetical protein QM775_02315 [Pirellulales bacterium]
MSPADYVIDRVEWHTEIADSPAVIAIVHEYFRSCITFLQENNLTKRQLLKPHQKITDDLQIATSDLTDEGLELIKACYNRWLKKVGNGTSPSDTSILAGQLKKLRHG